jgi:Holliday junction resolvasome RuvABC endonuclease subunit
MLLRYLVLILGWDVGINSSALAVTDIQNNTLRTIDHLFCAPPKSCPETLDLYNWLNTQFDIFLTKYSGIAVCYETPVIQGLNGAKMNTIIGIFLANAFRNGNKVYHVTPLHLKKVVTGNGKADKKEMLAHVTQKVTVSKSIMDLPFKVQNHLIDAIGCAYYLALDLGVVQNGKP